MVYVVLRLAFVCVLLYVCLLMLSWERGVMLGLLRKTLEQAKLSMFQFGKSWMITATTVTWPMSLLGWSAGSWKTWYVPMSRLPLLSAVIIG